MSNLRNASGRITVPIMDTSRLKQQKRTLRQNKLLGEERRERNSMKEKEFVSLRTPLDSRYFIS